MLSIKGLSKTYDNGVQALKNVNLEIPKGMFGLLGPNGAGKSTLMRTLATLQQADSGSINFDGLDILNTPDELRKTLGYLPQDFGVYPRLSAEKMLDHMAVLKGIENGGERKELIHNLLEQTNLYQVRNKSLSGFSGGMKQRFGIAQALIGDPKLIIVDEPTAGLDPEERNRFHNLLSDIGENVVVILSTHIVDDVTELCPLMAIMANGRIVTEGRPSDLVDNLQGQMWKKAISKAEVENYRAKFNVVSTRMFAGETVLHVQSPNDPGDGFSPLTADLEDVYFHTLSLQQSNGNTEAAA